LQENCSYLEVERDVKVDANVEKIHVTLSKPTPHDMRPDLERLLGQLKRYKGSYKSLITNFLKNCQRLLESENWDVTGGLEWEEIISVEGETLLANFMV